MDSSIRKESISHHSQSKDSISDNTSTHVKNDSQEVGVAKTDPQSIRSLYLNCCNREISRIYHDFSESGLK